SSRRRHTRFSRDWSSDVCSSDLTETPAYLHATYDTYPFIVFQDLVYVDQEGNVKTWIETEEFKKDAAFFREAYRKGLVNPDVLKIGRASCRERGERSEEAVSVKK